MLHHLKQHQNENDDSKKSKSKRDAANGETTTVGVPAATSTTLPVAPVRSCTSIPTWIQSEPRDANALAAGAGDRTAGDCGWKSYGVIGVGVCACDGVAGVCCTGVYGLSVTLGVSTLP